MPKLQQTKLGNFLISIPSAMVKLLGWQQGQELAIGAMPLEKKLIVYEIEIIDSTDLKLGSLLNEDGTA